MRIMAAGEIVGGGELSELRAAGAGREDPSKIRWPSKVEVASYPTARTPLLEASNKWILQNELRRSAVSVISDLLYFASSKFGSLIASPEVSCFSS
jgi:hypothetical protein